MNVVFSSFAFLKTWLRKNLQIDFDCLFKKVGVAKIAKLTMIQIAINIQDFANLKIIVRPIEISIATADDKK